MSQPRSRGARDYGSPGCVPSAYVGTFLAPALVALLNHASIADEIRRKGGAAEAAAPEPS